MINKEFKFQGTTTCLKLLLWNNVLYNGIEDEETLPRHHRHTGTPDTSHVLYISRHAGALLLLRYHRNGTVRRLWYEELLQVRNFVVIKAFNYLKMQTVYVRKGPDNRAWWFWPVYIFWSNLQTNTAFGNLLFLTMYLVTVQN